MKFYFIIFVIFFLSFIIIQFRPAKDLDKLPNNYHFKYQTKEILTIKKSLKIDIDSCLTLVELVLHDEEDVFIELSYNQTLDFTFINNTISLINDRGYPFCNTKDNINSYLKISIPNNLISLDIKINAYFTTLIGSDLLLNDFNFHANDVDTDLSNIKGKNITLDLQKGKVDLKHLKTENLTITNAVGEVNLTNGQINDTTLINLNKGNIVLNNVETNIMEIKKYYGKINLIEIHSNKLTLFSDYGDVDIKNSYSKIIYLNLIKGNINFINDKTYYISLLEYSLDEGEALFKVKGNIVKV